MATLEKELLKHDPVAESIVRFIQRVLAHWRTIVLVTGALLIAGGVVVSRVHQRQRLPQEASFALANARSADELQRVVRNYPQTFAAPAALAQLGHLMAMQTNYPAALQYYEELVAKYPRNFLVPAAQLAAVKCRIAIAEAESDPLRRRQLYEQAETILKRELLYNRDHYAALLAQLELVRLLTAMERYPEALEEMQRWDAEVGNTYFAALGDGLRERLYRITGASTNMPARESL
ncbi:MAG: hypothetical protein N2595_07905 [bacterium]|nr:hypothetical protein [bacterium]